MPAAKKTVAAATHENLLDALLAVQGAMPAFQRDAINPHFTSTYLTLETLLPQVLEVLNAHGVLLSQNPTYVSHDSGMIPALTTALTHVASKESLSTTMLLEAGASSPQKQGSAITYAKRYALMAALGITADKDTDGNVAGPRPAASFGGMTGAVPIQGTPMNAVSDAGDPFSAPSL